MVGPTSSPTRRTVLAGILASSIAGCTSFDDTTNSAGGGTTTRATSTTVDAVTDVGDFFDRDNWKTVTGSVDVTDTNSFRGDRSIRMTCGHSEKRVRCTYTFERPLDMRNSHLSFAFDYGPDSIGTGPTVLVHAPDTENMLLYDQHHNIDAGWVNAPLATPKKVVGNPDLGRVEALTFTQWTGGGVHEEIYLDALELVPRPTEPTVIFTFDDGRASVFDHAVPLLNQFDYAASTAVIPGREMDEGFLSMTRMGTLKRRGWDIMSHPQRADPLPAYSAEEQAAQITASKQWLLDHGFESGSRFIVYPYGGWNRSTLEIAAEHHELGFAGGGVSTWVPPMPMVVPRITGDDVEKVKAYVDRVSTYGGVLVLMYHAINDDWIDPASFRSVVSYVHEDPNVSVRSVGQWYDEIAGSMS